jgi:hypothetical protein
MKNIIFYRQIKFPSERVKENLLKLAECLRNKCFVLLKMSEFLKNKYFFNEKSPSYILIPEKDVFLKGKCPSFA